MEDNNIAATKRVRRNEELESELIKAEEKYNSINLNLKNIQEKLTIFRENKARNEATLSGIEQRKKDLIFSIKKALNYKIPH